MTLEELLKGKATQIKGKEYMSAEAYVTPFIERMSKLTDEFIVEAKQADQISVDEDNEDKVYNRVWIQAVLPEIEENHKEVIGLVYGLDIKKPVAKLYRGALNQACLNLCVFNPDFLNIQELEPERPINYRCLNPLMEQTSDIIATVKRMKETVIPYDNQEINESLGLWVRRTISESFSVGYGKVKLATTTAVDAYKLMYEKKDSPYYVQPNAATTLFNRYNAFTELITNTDTRDIISKTEKVLLLKKILGF